MPKIIYVEVNGTEHEVEVPVGTNIMQGAVNHLVPGIEGDCGGLCACGTCHVYVAQEWQSLCGEADELAAVGVARAAAGARGAAGGGGGTQRE